MFLIAETPSLILYSLYGIIVILAETIIVLLPLFFLEDYDPEVREDISEKPFYCSPQAREKF